MTLKITDNISIPESELEFSAIRAQGSGGQNVNKVSTAIHLRFDILASSLPEHYKNKLMAYEDYRISKQGIIIIKAQRYRSQMMNKQDALDRLYLLIKVATKRQKVRKATKPSKAAKQKRLDEKAKNAKKKFQRSQKSWD